MTKPKNDDKLLKHQKLRYAEYYGMTEIFDDLYSKSQNGFSFKNLMNIIISPENILLAYRTIKRNGGSQTEGVDGVTIKDLENLTQEDFISKVQRRFQYYRPRKVRRVEIPKPNGKKRPLGIPSMWDRVAQQCILQVLEPICEAKFYKHSYGFRPLRSADNAIMDCMYRMNKSHMTYVVDVDIKGFFDEVNHTKLMRQIWTLGIRDKQLLVIIRKMLKAPIVLPNGKVTYPTKGTPQGGILSPLLANINLNEFDWWIGRQWEERDCKELVPQYNSKGTRHKSHVYRKLRASTTLKEVYIVRYADDFKIFCRNRNEAERTFKAVKLWLKERLNLPISEEKSQITNLRKKSSEFLGITLKLVSKNNRLVCFSHIASKAKKRIKHQLKQQMKLIQIKGAKETIIREIHKYNSMVIGIHNYYSMATHVSKDLEEIHYQLYLSFKNRLQAKGLTKIGEYKGKDKGLLPYLQSQNIRYLMGYPILPISYVKTRTLKGRNKNLNRYTPEGRKLIHKQQESVETWKLKWLREHSIINKRATVEYNDNRISLFVAQKGKCAVTGQELDMDDIHCHHKRPWLETKDDSYRNLIIVKRDIHRLIHATNEKVIKNLFQLLNLSNTGLTKLNQLRELAGNPPLLKENLNLEQLC